MTLSIAQIANAALQKLAYLNDANNNGKLEEKEFIKFKSEVAKRQDISAEDFNQAMGLYITEPENKQVPQELPKVDVTKQASQKKEEIVLETDNKEVIEEFMPVAESVTKDGTTYKVKLGDTWASLAEQFGFTKKFPTLEEAVRAIKEAAGYGSKLNAAEMPKEIKIKE